MPWGVPAEGGKKMTELCTLTISPPDCRPCGGGVNAQHPRFRSGWRPADGRDAPGRASRRSRSIAVHIRSSAWPKDPGRRSSDRRAGTRSLEGTAAIKAWHRGGKFVRLHGLAGRLRRARAPEGRPARIRPAQKRARSAGIASSAAGLILICRASLDRPSLVHLSLRMQQWRLGRRPSFDTLDTKFEAGLNN